MVLYIAGGVVAFLAFMYWNDNKALSGKSSGGAKVDLNKVVLKIYKQQEAEKQAAADLAAARLAVSASLAEPVGK